jgi:hypothetical protein
MKLCGCGAIISTTISRKHLKTEACGIFCFSLVQISATAISWRKSQISTLFDRYITFFIFRKIYCNEKPGISNPYLSYSV